MRLLIVMTLCLLATTACADTDLDYFDARFEDATLRIDYTHTGDADTEFVALAAARRRLGTPAGARSGTCRGGDRRRPATHRTRARARGATSGRACH